MTAEDITQHGKQILVVAIIMILQVGLIIIIPPLVCYIIFATEYWWICLLYIAWYSIFDNDAKVTGRRRSEWFRSCFWWIYAHNYFPIRSLKLPWGELDRKRNYLFCFFPHGLLATGTFLSICTNPSEFRDLFAHHTPYLHVMNLFFNIPILREFVVSLGAMQASKEALQNILGTETGGNISALLVGGAQEAYFCNPGVHRVICRNRKGFIRVALNNGASLVPVYVFGENELYSQIELDQESIFHKLREVVRKNLGFSPVFPQGRKDMLGLFPRKKPLTVVVGEPIDVQKIENPTQEEVDHLHRLFLKKLVELFDTQKKYYLKDYETAHLEIF